MKINVPYVATIVIDMAMIILFSAACIYFLTDNLNPWNTFIALQSMILYTILHDHIHWILFYKYLAPEKVNFKYDLQLVKCTLKIALIFGALGMFDTYSGNYFFTWNGWETVVLVYFEYNFMYQAKDNTSMRFIHAWMHKQENYWIHEHHHESEGNCQAATTFHFDLLDIFLENILGSVLLKIFYVIIGRPSSLHLLSFLWLIWSDQLGHSMNPWVPCLINPILDHYCKLNIVHNLHHLIKAGYYMSTPYNHVYDPKSLVDDVNKYNRKLKTNISVDLFLPDDYCQLNDEWKKMEKEN